MGYARRETRIPRPPGVVRAPALKEREVLQENNNQSVASRKRKAGSPVKPPAKRPAPASARNRTASATTVQKSGAAVASSAPSAEESWDHVGEQLGWEPEDCLNHKLVFKKREDMKTTKDTLLQHIKRLRALGWHLLMLKEKNEMDTEALRGALHQEESSHAEDKSNHETLRQNLQQSIDGLEAQIAEIRKELELKTSKVKTLDANWSSSQNQVSSITIEKDALEAECSRLKGQLSDAQEQASIQSGLHQNAQQYTTQLQGYNTKLQTELQSASADLKILTEERNSRAEETASLRGTISALEARVTTAQAAISAAEDARLQASSDCSRLRNDLERTTSQRDEAQASAATAQAELTRYKECTGKSVENLEREKASKAVLESQNKAQVEYNCELQDELAQLKAQLAMSQTSNERQANKTADVEARRKELEVALHVAEQKLREGEILRRKLHNTILELKGNIRVFCRVRPLTLDHLATESVNGKEIVQFTTSGELAGQALEIAVNSSAQATANHKFTFDKVFTPSARQEEVFEEISQLVQSALDGYKVCIFAYGQTGSGKTFTMMGPPDTENRGVIPRAVNQLFEACEQMREQGWTFEMKASMVEIYNEEVKDLLGKGPPAGKKHQISHDDYGNTNVSFVEYVDCKRPERVRDLLAKASRVRSVGATAANEQSSRSHMVFSMSITGSNESSGQQIKGMLNLIDLAGSERLSKSLAVGERLKETQAINKSLSALGDVIVALGGKESHIPYRNSKLTYLLQPCLGGDAKTLMFVNIAPTVDASNESLCSLRFAAKVNATEIGTAKRNVGSK